MAADMSASALQAGFIELASIVRALHGDWSAPADGYEGWTCHDLLAHLSSSEASLAAVAMSSTQEPKAGAEPFDADRWNRSQVRKRAEKDEQELLNEFDHGTTQLIEVLADMDLGKPVNVGAFPGYTVAAAMAEMLEHQRKHLHDLREALHSHPQT